MAAAAYGLYRFRHRLRLPRAFAAVAVAAWPLAAARALPRGRAPAYATFLAHTASYLAAFELPHDDQGEQRRRLGIHHLVALDRALGAGITPGARLQALRSRSPRARTLLDPVLGLVYFAWAPERHAALLWVLGCHPRRFARAAALVSAVFDLTLAIQARWPTAPPWWAAKYGFLQEPLRRVTVDAAGELPLVPGQSADEAEEANPWASMPSPHMGTAAMVALVLGELDPRAGALAATYATALGLALVYLGEHYAIEVIAGLALAAGVYALEPALRGPARGVARIAAGQSPA